MLRQQEEWLVDENLEATMPDGEAFAARLYEPEGFATSSGVIVPTTAEGLQRVWHVMGVAYEAGSVATASDEGDKD